MIAMLALRPAWANWTPHVAALRVKKCDLPAQAEFARRLQIPMSPGVMRPRGDCGGLNKDQSGAADRAAAEMHQMPVGGEAIWARILAHGRNGDPVGKFETRRVSGENKFTESEEVHGPHNRTCLANYSKCPARAASRN